MYTFLSVYIDADNRKIQHSACIQMSFATKLACFKMTRMYTLHFSVLKFKTCRDRYENGLKLDSNLF